MRGYDAAKHAITKFLSLIKATYKAAKCFMETLVIYVELCVTNPTAAWRVLTLFNCSVFDVNYESDPVILEAVIQEAKSRSVTAQT